MPQNSSQEGAAALKGVLASLKQTLHQKISGDINNLPQFPAVSDAPPSFDSLDISNSGRKAHHGDVAHDKAEASSVIKRMQSQVF